MSPRPMRCAEACRTTGRRVAPPGAPPSPVTRWRTTAIAVGTEGRPWRGRTPRHLPRVAGARGGAGYPSGPWPPMAAVRSVLRSLEAGHVVLRCRGVVLPAHSAVHAVDAWLVER